MRDKTREQKAPASATSGGVTVHVVDTVEQFTALINWCRRPKGVAPRSGSLGAT